MEKSLFLLCILPIVLIFALTMVSAADCGGDVACNCGDSLTSNRVLNESDTLTGCSGSGLIIAASSIVLDCNGSEITSINQAGYGINDYIGYTGLTIQNCKIYNFSEGIDLDGSSSVLITNNTLKNNSYAGIYASSVSGLEIRDNIIDGNNVDAPQYGVYLSPSVTGANIFHNNIYNNSLNINSDNPIELSNGSDGNYWGHDTCPVFTPGIDSNGENVIDSYAYNESDGWNYGAPATCIPPVSCGDIISSSTNLTEDLIDCPGNGLLIDADNVVLDCAGHSITGTTGPFGIDYGVSVNSYYENITIKNCLLTNFWGGIFFSFSSTTGSSVINNTAWGNARGFHLFGNFIEVSNNTAYDNMEHGMHFASGSAIDTISGNNLSNNPGNGMHFDELVSAGLISNNIMNYNTGIGLFCEFTSDGCAFSNILNNTVNNNNNYGISIRTNVATVIANNTANGNSGAGLAFSNSANGFISDNAFNDNTDRGIKIDGIINYTISGNNLTGNGYGISISNSYFIDGENNTINFNRIFNNTNADIENSGSGNNATFNYWGEPFCSVKLSGISKSELTPYYTDEALTILSSDIPFCFCDDTITSDTTLTQNYTCSSGGGITIGADNITLDCDGYSLTGSGSNNGISVNSYSNVTIKNCSLTNFYVGTYFIYSSNNILTNNIATSSYIGFFFDSGAYNNIISNTANNNQYGIYLNPSADNNNITNNTLTNNSNIGVYINAGSNNIINFNKIYNNTNYDAQQDSSTGNNFTFDYWGEPFCSVKLSGISRNELMPYYTDEAMTILDSTPCLCGITITENMTLASNYTCPANGPIIGASDITLDCNGSSITGDSVSNVVGIKSSGYSGVTIENCEISGFRQGILSSNGNNNYILNNTVNNNSQYGIGIRQADDYTIQHNKITNSSIAIRAVSSSGNIIDNNTIISPHNKGIALGDADSNNITDNTIENADVYGIYLYSAGVFSNNLVQGNIISLSETDVAPSSKFGIVLEDDNNEIYDNTIDCTSKNPDYPHVGIWISGLGGNAENNILSGNEIFNCDYGFDAWDADYFEASNEEYYNNSYGAYLQGAGTSSTLPLIENSRIYDNSHGIYLTSSSYANISNTNFTNNIGTEGVRESGIHVEPGSVAYVTNGRFISNGEYGIYDAGPFAPMVYWTINDHALCGNNDINIESGNITFDGGTLELDNCTISLNGLLLNLSGNITALNSETQDVTQDVETDFDFTEVDSNITLVLSSGTTTTIAVFPESPNASGTTASLTALKGLDIQVDSTTSGALTWALIKIFYDEAELTAADIDESTLKIYFYNVSLGDWQLEPVQDVDEANNYVWANVTHFSLFGAFGTAPVAAAAIITPTEGGGGCLTNWTCSEWGDCLNEAQTRTCTKVRELCYARDKPEETQACSAEGITGEVTGKQNNIIAALTSKGWWTLVLIIAIVSIAVLIISFLVRIRSKLRFFIMQTLKSS